MKHIFFFWWEKKEQMLSTHFLIESLEQSDTWMKKLRLRETKLPIFTQMLRIKTGLWIWLQSINASTFEYMTTLEDRKNYTSPWCLSQKRACIPKVTMPSTLPKPDVDIENIRRKIKNFHMYIRPTSGGAGARYCLLALSHHSPLNTHSTECSRSKDPV